MTNKKLLIVAAILMVGAACSSTDNGGAVNTPPPSSAAPASPSASTCPTPAASPSGTPTAVSATDALKFEPSAVSVKVGATVQWTVTGTSTHTVTAQAGEPCSFDSGNLDAGAKYALTFTAAGTYKYFCRIHGQSMSGTITVTQ